MSPEFALALYRETVRLATHPDWTPADQMAALAALAERLFAEATKQEALAFSTLFARICYMGHRYNLPVQHVQRLHLFRRNAARLRKGQYTAEPRDVKLGVQVLAETVLALCGTALPSDIIALLPAADEWPVAPPEHWEFKQTARVVALRDDPAQQCLLAVDEDEPETPIRIRYNLPDRNENFNPTIELIRKVFRFPISLYLTDIDIDAGGVYRPRMVVVSPDYLVDVSAVSECFQEQGATPLHYLVRKFLPQETTGAILLGNLANYFLDRLLQEPDAPYLTLFKEHFAQMPFHYAPLADADVRLLSQKAQMHYLNIRQMAKEGFAAQQISPDDCVLEPSFFSVQHGLQGRLDLFYRTDERAAIVELKSGTPFRPNSYGVQRSHFTQTLLYDLLVRSVYGAQLDPTKYILYSGVPEKPLRFAPTVAPEQWEAIQVRNQLVAIEYLLTQIQPGEASVPVLQRLRAVAIKEEGFLKKAFAQFERMYTLLNPLEQKYFNAFVGFIARENWLAKAGREENDGIEGLAARWRQSLAEKEQAFAVLSHLEIADNRADQNEPSILFRKTVHTNPLANFRVGDIALLYPAPFDEATVLDHQVIKCTIAELDKDHVRVQLRHRQFNLKAFDVPGPWRLEPDLMETGFAHMYRGLFEWANANAERRQALLLPSDRPHTTHPTVATPYPQLTAEQQAVFAKMVAGPPLFLLWGPPGTGKTSVMLHTLAHWVLHETTDNLLLLAYTNRAVDEICAALDELGGDVRTQYMRLGNHLSCAPAYRDQLIQRFTAGVEKRADLRHILDARRIFVSTVSSFAQNEGLLRLKKFQRVVIDEASQLLEPQLVGLLTRFERTILIGDHRQLPAVTTQSVEWTRVNDPDLQQIGLVDLRDSYFERLYRYCAQHGLEGYIGRLSRQGRMHPDLMAFPNKHFYGGLLRTLRDEVAAPTVESRVQFVSVKMTPQTLPHQKTNAAEAELAALLVAKFKARYAAEGRIWEPSKSLGIITPWRAQIAQLRATLTAQGIDPDDITIDTVERYQGGAREIILISTCVHSTAQLGQLISLSAEQIDRKLNVALTRARHYVVVLGNAEVLQQDDRYRAFMEEYGVNFEETAVDFDAI